MSDEKFPYGNDPLKPQDWVGSPQTKSGRWYVTYDGGFSMVVGYHSFIFMGLENMCIGIVNLKGGGPTVSLPIGKILKGGWGLGAEAVEKIDKMLDRGGKAKTGKDIYDRESEQANIQNASAFLARMQEGITEALVARTPFSFNDLGSMVGTAAGADIELVGAASAYEIYGGCDGQPNRYFGPKIVASAGWGLVGAGVGIMKGWWEVEKVFSLYHELGRGSSEKCLKQNSSPSYAQPYQEIPGLHPYLSSLPPAGCDVPPEHFHAANLLSGARP